MISIANLFNPMPEFLHLYDQYDIIPSIKKGDNYEWIS